MTCRTVNATMRSRTKHADWQPVFDDAQTWLDEIPDDLDIIEADDNEWEAASGAALVSKAIESLYPPADRPGPLDEGAPPEAAACVPGARRAGR